MHSDAFDIDLKEFVVILGTGKSLNNLPFSMTQQINRSHARIAINKFGSFHDFIRIKPSHVYFHDFFSKSSQYFLQKTIDKTKSLGVSYFLSEEVKTFITHNILNYAINKCIYELLVGFLRLGRKISSKLKLNKISILFTKQINNCKPPILINKSENIRYVSCQNWTGTENKWANQMTDPLFHYRGSLSTVLNIVSILYPKRPILLLGVDMDKSGHFYDDYLSEKEKKITVDWTTGMMKRENKHFSLIDYKGTSFIDKLPFMKTELSKSGNLLYSYPNNSFLVNQNFALPINCINYA